MDISLQRHPLSHLPTPLERADRLSQALGSPNFYVKRDDATGLAGGGNKARKLEFLLAEALEQEADYLITVGGVQSNHARMTAAAAASLGLGCRLYLRGDGEDNIQGNLLLDKVLGAETVFCGSREYPEIYQLIEKHCRQLEKEGVHPYVIPLGGSSPLGVLGYARMVTEELVAQCKAEEFEPSVITLAVGSGGTMAGVLLGAALAGWSIPVRGYSVSYPAAHLKEKVARLYNQAAQLLGVEMAIDQSAIDIDDNHVGPGYGVATPQCLEAVTLFARSQGLLLDSVYTGKAAAGTMADIARGLWPRGGVLFVHTGGWPALFAKQDVIEHFGGEETL